MSDDLDALISEGWEAAQASGAVEKAADPETDSEPELDVAPDDVAPDDPELEDAAEDDDDESDDRDDDDSEDDDSEDDEENPPKEKKAAAPEQRGSKDNPLTIKDVEKQWAKVKIDGEDQVINLRHALENGMRQQAFDSRAHKLKQLTQEAERHTQHVQKQLQTYQRGVLSTLSDAERLRTYLETHNPDVLDDLAMAHYPEIYKAHEAGKLDTWKAQRKLKQRERYLDAKYKAAERAEQEAAQRREIDRRRSIVAPAIRQAIEANGFEPPSDSQIRRIGIALDIEEKMKGGELTADDVRKVAEEILTRSAGKPATSNGKKDKKPRRRKAPPVVQAKRARDRSNGKSRGPSKYDQYGNLSTEWLLSQAG